jgi:hypothetical protein
VSALGLNGSDWTEAERLWRSGAAMDEKLAMVERALAALAGSRRTREKDFDAAEGRGLTRSNPDSPIAMRSDQGPGRKK